MLREFVSRIAARSTLEPPGGRERGEREGVEEEGEEEEERERKRKRGVKKNKRGG